MIFGGFWLLHLHLTFMKTLFPEFLYDFCRDKMTQQGAVFFGRGRKKLNREEMHATETAYFCTHEY